MNSYAYYRLPYSDSYTVLESERNPLVLTSYESIGSDCGFIIAPFSITDETPLLLIQPDSIASHKVPQQESAEVAPVDECRVGTANDASPSYCQAFAAFHDAVSDGRLHKLVLARLSTITVDSADVEALFLRACQLYPRLMIMLFHTPQSGTWLISSPEILIETCQGERQLHTIALAGTMPYAEGYPAWSEKNKAEQHIVEQYIEDSIRPMCRHIIKDGPVTMRAGNLAHLRTDFRFTLDTGISLGCVISRLHPTPAVCGMPKHEAQQFIAEHEQLDRRYYSGFAGPVGINGETHLYVSLRCASLTADTAILYAGGGIMPESQCDAEWQETENKMLTIRKVLTARNKRFIRKSGW